MNYRLAACVLTAVWITVAGCTGSSAPSRFYTLNTGPGTQAPSIREVSAGSIIGVGPVEVPAYLDRPQIVTRISPNELKLAEFHHWAEPLKDTIARVLVENISNAVDPGLTGVFPWKGPMEADYQVAVEVIRFDGNLGTSVNLIAQWTIIDAETEKRLLTQKARIDVRTVGSDFKALVAAQSLAVEQLSNRIVSSINRILSRTDGSGGN